MPQENLTLRLIGLEQDLNEFKTLVATQFAVIVEALGLDPHKEKFEEPTA